MGFLTGLSLRVWGILALIALILIGWGVWEHTKNEVVDLKAEVNAQTTTIAIQKAAIVIDRKLDKVNEQTQSSTQQVVKAVAVKHEAIQTKVEVKTEAIEEKYADTPLTMQTAEGQQDELSSARIDSLWEAYCTAVSSALQCQPQPQGEPHA